MPEADWIAGLAAFRLKQIRRGGEAFRGDGRERGDDVVAEVGGGVLGGAILPDDQQPEKVSRMLEIAAEKPRTFYGLIALRLLGREPPFTWNEPELEQGGLPAADQECRASRAASRSIRSASWKRRRVRSRARMDGSTPNSIGRSSRSRTSWALRMCSCWRRARRVRRT